MNRIDFFRKVGGQTFRKGLIPDYKKEGRVTTKDGKHTVKNPHAIPLQKKYHLLHQKGRGDPYLRIRDEIRKSRTPYGKFISTKFVFDSSRLPFYDIPDLTGFELKPYVSFLTPKMDKNTIPSPWARLNTLKGVAQNKQQKK